MEKARPTLYPDDVSELILSVGADDLCFAGPDDHLDDDGGTLRGSVEYFKQKYLKQTADSGLEPSLLPDMKEEIATPKSGTGGAVWSGAVI